MARSAWAYSAMRAAGATHGTENRRSLCAFTWLPSPSTKRPCECRCKSQAWLATIIGLRGNAIATEVASCARSVASAAKARGVNGSCRSSLAVMQSKPSSSACRAAGPQAAQSSTGSTVDTRILGLLWFASR